MQRTKRPLVTTPAGEGLEISGLLMALEGALSIIARVERKDINDLRAASWAGIGSVYDTEAIFSEAIRLAPRIRAAMERGIEPAIPGQAISASVMTLEGHLSIIARVEGKDVGKLRAASWARIGSVYDTEAIRIELVRLIPRVLAAMKTDGFLPKAKSRKRRTLH